MYTFRHVVWHSVCHMFRRSNSHHFSHSMLHVSLPWLLILFQCNSCCMIFSLLFFVCLIIRPCMYVTLLDPSSWTLLFSHTPSCRNRSCVFCKAVILPLVSLGFSLMKFEMNPLNDFFSVCSPSSPSSPSSPCSS